jgi:hypothetical protein
MKQIAKLSLQQYFCFGPFSMSLIFVCYLPLTGFQILNFDVLMVVTVKCIIFWDVMLCGLVEVYHYTALHPRRQGSSLSNLITVDMTYK